MIPSTDLIALALAASIAICGCAAKTKTAAVPGCSPSAAVSVPKRCYSIIFDGALEIRCDTGETTRYICATPNNEPHGGCLSVEAQGFLALSSVGEGGACSATCASSAEQLL